MDDCRKCQTATATPAEPGDLLWMLAYFHQIDVPTLIHVALFMMLWVGGIVAIDYWVGARRSDPPRRGTGRPTWVAEISRKVGRLEGANL